MTLLDPRHLIQQTHNSLPSQISHAFALNISSYPVFTVEYSNKQLLILLQDASRAQHHEDTNGRNFFFDSSLYSSAMIFKLHQKDKTFSAMISTLKHPTKNNIILVVEEFFSVHTR